MKRERGPAIPDTSKYWADEWGVYSVITERERDAAQKELDSLPEWKYQLFRRNRDDLAVWLFIILIASLVLLTLIAL